MGPEVCSLDYVTDYIPEESPVTDIVASKGSVSNNNTGEERKYLLMLTNAA